MTNTSSVKDSARAETEPVTIITTHINADFDALASMVAAQKLYPGALAVFPGSHEKNLRDFYLDSMAYLLNMADISEIDMDQVRLLVLVDTKQPQRIGKLAELLEGRDVEVHIYDHHPDQEHDIKGNYVVNESVGATVSILIEILREKGIDITPDEATIMSVGIYEDTGSFTFSSTTEKDFTAAAYLLSKGANLNTVSEMISREINPFQVFILNELFQSAVDHNVNGVEVTITTISTDHYVSDFAFLVHKMVKMENLDVVFAMALMGNKLNIVGRSRTQDVDVGSILRRFGGGGHPYAASAAVKDMTLIQAEQKLLKLLYDEVKSSLRARNLMTSPVITAEPDISCLEAKDRLTKYNINALLVTKPMNGNNRLLGYITRQVIEKALYLNLESASIKDYMTVEPGFVEPDSALSEIQEKIIDNKQRLLPVMKNGKILGVITRTDLLNTLVAQRNLISRKPPDPFAEDPNAKMRNVLPLMKERLNDEMFKLLRSVGEVAGELDYGVFAVGGFVRDLFLQRTNEDIDIVLEGDGILSPNISPP